MSAPQPQKTGSFALARAFWRAYPRQTLVIVAAFIAAGIMESVGVTTILPLLSVLSPSQAVPGPVDQAVSAVFGFFGVTPAIAPMLCVIVALLCAKAAVSYFAMSKVNYITVTIGKDMRVRLVNALLRAQWAHFPGLAVGKSANAIGTEAARAALGYMSLGRGLADCIQVVIYIVFALFISWPITLAAFAAGAGIAFMLKGLIAMSRRAGTAQTALMASIAARVTDTLSGIKAIKAMGCENFFIKVLEQENEQLAKAQYSEYTASQLLVIAREPILALILAAGLYAAVVHAGVPVAVLLVLAFMFFRVVSKITAMQSNFQRMASMESAYWSLQSAIAQAESAAENFTAGGAGVPERADIRFEDVSW